MNRANVDASKLRHVDAQAEEHCDPRAQPYEALGALNFPAMVCRQGTVTINDDAAFVELTLVARSMLGNDIGVFVRLTPEGARSIAAQLIADAHEVDAVIAEQAAAAIEAARQNGGPQ